MRRRRRLTGHRCFPVGLLRVWGGGGGADHKFRPATHFRSGKVTIITDDAVDITCTGQEPFLENQNIGN